tara:strand:- start:1634 stop:2476 length:843 start_codon:yes stop_codon:yes gene_type:complete
MEEYYVRPPESEQSDGPFTIAQLSELVSSEIVHPATLYYKEGMEDFAPISSNPGLWEQIKPKPKVALKLRRSPPESQEIDNDSSDESKVSESSPKDAPVPPKASPLDESGNVDKMLAAAEGKTSETKYVQNLKKSRNRAVALLLPVVVLGLLMLAATIVFPFRESVFEMFQTGNYSFDVLLENWILFFAIADLILAIGIGLGQTSLFPLLRFRCALGFGFFLYFFYSQQNLPAAGAMSALQIGMLGATLCIRLVPTLLFSLLTIAGGGFMIWITWLQHYL